MAEKNAGARRREQDKESKLKRSEKRGEQEVLTSKTCGGRGPDYPSSAVVWGPSISGIPFPDSECHPLSLLVESFQPGAFHAFLVFHFYFYLYFHPYFHFCLFSPSSCLPPSGATVSKEAAGTENKDKTTETAIGSQKRERHRVKNKGRM